MNFLWGISFLSAVSISLKCTYRVVPTPYTVCTTVFDFRCVCFLQASNRGDFCLSHTSALFTRSTCMMGFMLLDYCALQSTVSQAGSKSNETWRHLCLCLRAGFQPSRALSLSYDQNLPWSDAVISRIVGWVKHLRELADKANTLVPGKVYSAGCLAFYLYALFPIPVVVSWPTSCNTLTPLLRHLKFSYSW